MAKHRTQLFLDEDQYETLAHLARNEERSISGVVRDLIDLGLKQAEGDAQRRLEVLAELAAFGREAGPIERDLVLEVRSDRARQLDAILIGKKNAQ